MFSLDKKHIKKCILLAVWILAFLYRFIGISKYAKGLHVDEASIGYDAFCIANYGVDRHLLSYPLLFPGFGGGGHSALYTYCCAVLVKLIGSNIFSLRLPAVFFSMITVIVGCYLVRDIFHDDRMEIGYALISSFTPYFFYSSRFGLDCNLMLGTSTIFLFYFIKAANTEKNRFFVLAGISGGLVLYTYSLAYLILPLFLLGSLWYVIRNKRIRWEQAVLFTVPLVVLALPLVLIQYINLTNHESLFIGPFSFPNLNNYRGSELTYPHLYFFVQTLFVTLWHDELAYNSNPKWGNLFILSVPFIVLAFLRMWKHFKMNVMEHRYDSADFILFWIIAQWAVGAMLQGDGGVNVNRMNGIFMCYGVLASWGIVRCCEQIKNEWRNVAGGLIILAYCICLWGFLQDIISEKELKINFECNYEAGMEFLSEHHALSCRTRIMLVENEMTIFYRYAAKLNPYLERETDEIANVFYGWDQKPMEDKVYIVDHRKVEDITILRSKQDFCEQSYDGYSIFYK